MYQVYVLYSPSFGKIYVGQTSDLASRIKSHNEESTKGYTKRYRPWELVYVEEYETRSEAMRREKALKSGQGRAWIWSEIIERSRRS